MLNDVRVVLSAVMLARFDRTNLAEKPQGILYTPTDIAVVAAWVAGAGRCKTSGCRVAQLVERTLPKGL